MTTPRPATPPPTPPTTPPASTSGPAVGPPVRRASAAQFTVRSPEDLLAVVPVVLGFEPAESVVMLTFGGAETFHARVDLPPPDEAEAVVALLVEPALQHRVESVVLVVYADDGPAARAVVGALRSAFGQAAVEVLEVLRAHEGRWFVPGRRGVPRWGVPYDVADHRFRAQAVVEGIVVHRSRAELAEVVVPRPARVAQTRRALRRALPSPAAELTELVATRLATGRFSDAELAGVLLGVLEPPGRDAAWATLTRETSPQHLRLWTDAVQRAPEELAPGPLAVLGLTAWLAGHGALAWCAVDRCRQLEPTHSLAGLVADLLTHAVPPSTWPGCRP